MDSSIAMDEKKRLASFILIVLSLFILAVGAIIFFPFLKSAAWAIIIVLLLYPIYNRLNSFLKDRRAISATIMCIVVVAFIIVPSFFLFSALTEEAIKVYQRLESSRATDMTQVLPWLARYKETFTKYFPTVNFETRDIFSATSGRVGEFLVQESTLIFKNLLQFLAYLIFTLVITYYLFKEGDRFLTTIQELLPLSRIDAEMFTNRIYKVLIATLRGSLLTACLQAALGGLILWILGFSAPILWGTLMGIATFIPILGASVVWLPAVGYLLVKGSIFKALILAGFGALVISQVDYILRPILISGKAKIHNLLLFFSIIGGLWSFGLLGIFLGPIFVSLAIAVLEIYKLKVLERRT